MAFHDLDRYIVRNHTSSYLALETMFKNKRSAETTHGPKGRVFDLPAGLQVMALDHHHLQIGSEVIRTEVFALASAPLMAVVDASPSFRQYTGLDGLLQALHDPDIGVKTFKKQLAGIVAEGLHTDQLAQLVTPSSGFLASWLPAQTCFIRTTKGHWFTSLAFRLNADTNLRSAGVQTTFGLDLGSSPVVCAAGGDQRVMTFGGQQVSLLDSLRHYKDYSAEEKRVLRTLTYALGRIDAEAAILYLAQHGTTVFAEQLTLDGMWDGFIANGRLQATFDFHFSWLSQSLYRAGVPFKRVNAHWTSQLCHIHTNTIGKRDGKNFFCPDCVGQQHADVNAAFNIHQRGMVRFGVLPKRRVRALSVSGGFLKA